MIKPSTWFMHIRAEAQRERIIKRATLRAQWDAAGRLGSFEEFEQRQTWAEIAEFGAAVLLFLVTIAAWFPVIMLWWGPSCC